MLAISDSKILPIILLVISIYLIAYYTIFYRSISNEHIFVFINHYSNEFYRELLMNTLLYVPLGLSLPYLLKSNTKAILIALVLSFIIELWQYTFGTGMAQGTDVLCNTLGCAIGSISYIIYKHFNGKE